MGMIWEDIGPTVLAVFADIGRFPVGGGVLYEEGKLTDQIYVTWESQQTIGFHIMLVCLFAVLPEILFVNVV